VLELGQHPVGDIKRRHADEFRPGMNPRASAAAAVDAARLSRLST
jgi:hypothetical protein